VGLRTLGCDELLRARHGAEGTPRARFIGRFRQAHELPGGALCQSAMAISLSFISRSQDQRSRTDNLVGQGAVAGLPPGEEFPGRKRGDAHALTPLEREMIVQVANEPRFADKPPARIVPALADAGICLASESSFQRLLRERRQTAHRGRAKPPRKVRPPTTRVATAPRKVWCWDVTYLPVLILGHWFYLYLIPDIFSRKIVGFEVHATDDGEHAALLLKRTALAEGLHPSRQSRSTRSAKQPSRRNSGQLTKIGKPREEEATSILTRTGTRCLIIVPRYIDPHRVLPPSSR
jgi:hypothetical protein